MSDTPHSHTPPYQDAPRYASSCYLPCEWVELRLITRTEHTHDTTIYGFGLPDDRPLNLPACSCVLIKVAGKGRKARDGHDGADAVRPYVPITEPEITGRFDSPAPPTRTPNPPPSLALASA